MKLSGKFTKKNRKVSEEFQESKKIPRTFQRSFGKVSGKYRNNSAKIQKNSRNVSEEFQERFRRIPESQNSRKLPELFMITNNLL